jgi:short-subunit dehydrogenase
LRNILIIGACSAIAQATARRFAKAGDALLLVARNEDRLQAVAADLRTRGAASVATLVLDVLDYARHRAIVEHAAITLGGLDLALIAHGSLPNQKASEASFTESRLAFETNTLSVISLLTELASYFAARGNGTIVVISSVAGDRGRQSNYTYGAAKGAITLYLQGLRNRLYRDGVQVITIKPGMVDTPMTSAFDKGPLWASPDQVARGIDKAIRQGKNVAYVPWVWKYIMLVIRLIPEWIFKRLSL